MDNGQDKTLYTLNIAGTQYYSALNIISRVPIGTELTARREPSNDFDTNAIELFLPNGEKCGYVPASHAQGLSLLMDLGVILSFKISAQDRKAKKTQFAITLESFPSGE